MLYTVLTVPRNGGMASSAAAASASASSGPAVSGSVSASFRTTAELASLGVALARGSRSRRGANMSQLLQGELSEASSARRAFTSAGDRVRAQLRGDFSALGERVRHEHEKAVAAQENARAAELDALLNDDADADEAALEADAVQNAGAISVFFRATDDGR